MTALVSRVRALWSAIGRRHAAEPELDEEVRVYADLLTAEFARAGLDPARARRAALVQLGGIEQTKEATRDARPGRWFDILVRDVRYALRGLRRSPAFSALTILTLAVGIGGSATIFTVVSGALLRPPPGIVAPDRLVALIRVQPGGPFDNFGYPDYLAFRDQARSLSGVAARLDAMLTVSHRGAAADRIRGALVTGNYFDLLGVAPQLGRLLTPADDHTGPDNPVVVLSDGLWRRAFGASDSVLGARVLMTGRPFTIVGVSAPSFHGSSTGAHVDLWVPLSMQPLVYPGLSAGIWTDRAAGWLELVGRLGPGVDQPAAATELRTIAARLARAYPTTNAHRSVALDGHVGLLPDDRDAIAPTLLLLSAAVALLLLIACANVAGLMLVRSAGRRRELATRVAIGASPGRLVRQLLTEGVVLAAVASALAILLARFGARLATSAQPPSSVLRDTDVPTDHRVLVFAIGLAVFTGLALSAVPAFAAARIPPHTVLKDGAAGAGRRHSRGQRSLVILQIAVSFGLLSGAAVVTEAFVRLLAGRPGFETTHLAMLTVDPSSRGYSSVEGATLRARVLDAAIRIPGVDQATLASSVPPVGDYGTRVSAFRDGEAPSAEEVHGREFELGTRVYVDWIAPSFFTTMGTPLLSGRAFGDEDRPNSPPVVIVDRRLAQAMWPGREAVGQRMVIASLRQSGQLTTATVVGVAADTRFVSLTSAPPLLVYVPSTQSYAARTRVVIRMSGDPGRALAELQAAVRRVDPTLPISGATTMQAYLSDSLWSQRTVAIWAGVFGALALLLSAVGVYGVIAQSVAQRTRELGVRLALGANPAGLFRLVLREGLALAGLGLALGAPIAVGVGRQVAARLEGVGAWSPWGSAAIALVLLALTLAACHAPARRAARINLAELLRGD